MVTRPYFSQRRLICGPARSPSATTSLRSSAWNATRFASAWRWTSTSWTALISSASLRSFSSSRGFQASRARSRSASCSASRRILVQDLFLGQRRLRGWRGRSRSRGRIRAGRGGIGRGGRVGGRLVDVLRLGRGGIGSSSAMATSGRAGSGAAAGSAGGSGREAPRDRGRVWRTTRPRQERPASSSAPVELASARPVLVRGEDGR